MKAVILVGHGGVPRGFPPEKLSQLKKLESQRRRTGGPLSAEEQSLDDAIRNIPRTVENDPYQAGLQRIGAALRERLDPEERLYLAYNEFCAPSLPQAVEHAIEAGATHVVVVSVMVTPGGSHAAREIPEDLNDLRAAHPGVRIDYPWPFDERRVAQLLVDQVRTV